MAATSYNQVYEPAARGGSDNSTELGFTHDRPKYKSAGSH